MASSTINKDIKIMEFTLDVNETVPANNGVSKMMGYVPSGYVPFNIYYDRSGGGNIFSLSTYLQNGAVYAVIGNYSTGGLQFSGTIHVILCKTS